MTVWLNAPAHAGAAESLLTQRQRFMAGGVRRRLRAAAVEFTEGLESTLSEARSVFRLAPPAGVDVEVTILIMDHLFEFRVNGARLRRSRGAGWANDSEWIDECLAIVDALVTSELRVRVRRTLFGRVAGAVWLPAANAEGAWNGDARACRGKGQEFAFPSLARAEHEAD